MSQLGGTIGPFKVPSRKPLSDEEEGSLPGAPQQTAAPAPPAAEQPATQPVQEPPEERKSVQIGRKREEQQPVADGIGRIVIAGAAAKRKAVEAEYAKAARAQEAFRQEIMADEAGLQDMLRGGEDQLPFTRALDDVLKGLHEEFLEQRSARERSLDTVADRFAALVGANAKELAPVADRIADVMLRLYAGGAEERQQRSAALYNLAMAVERLEGLRAMRKLESERDAFEQTLASYQQTVDVLNKQMADGTLDPETYGREVAMAIKNALPSFKRRARAAVLHNLAAQVRYLTTAPAMYAGSTEMYRAALNGYQKAISESVKSRQRGDRARAVALSSLAESVTDPATFSPAVLPGEDAKLPPTERVYRRLVSKAVQPYGDKLGRAMEAVLLGEVPLADGLSNALVVDGEEVYIDADTLRGVLQGLANSMKFVGDEVAGENVAALLHTFLKVQGMLSNPRLAKTDDVAAMIALFSGMGYPEAATPLAIAAQAQDSSFGQRIIGFFAKVAEGLKGALPESSVGGSATRYLSGMSFVANLNRALATIFAESPQYDLMSGEQTEKE